MNKQETLNAATAVEQEMIAAGSSNAAYVEKAQQEMNEKREKEQIKRTAVQLCRDEFDQKREYLGFKYQDKLADIENESLKLRTEENEKFRAGGVEIIKHQERLQEIEKETAKKKEILQKEYDSLYDTLKTNYNEGYQASSHSRAPWDNRSNRW